ncbi:hypothetical protein AM571_PB00262 (plasmid) [Rhizobium etli 8C-3]|uniref:Uncharacterized protein n=1 Tax=Rhizobium etli 8C-3 TaxID=538025 RepID=A0A1L5PBD8_RHIET|nr:hypothetical protein AM571_PB00262 [Rhizobium etli 8C-3]
MIARELLSYARGFKFTDVPWEAALRGQVKRRRRECPFADAPNATFNSRLDLRRAMDQEKMVELHDRETIRDCLYRYCRGIDRRTRRRCAAPSGSMRRTIMERIRAPPRLH